MVTAVCVNGDLNTSQYGSPMPMIGAYIALATLVCFLSISFDIFHGFHRRTPWLPCKLFSLNSFTLTVVSVAAKLPVDLSTPMPRAADQLSKITGSVLICISMGVFMPSLGSMRTSECLANMAALTVLVITVVVNIRIQILTGVIFTFIPEHVTLLICMLVLLMALWSSALTLYLPKKFCNSEYREAAEDYPSEWSLESMRKQLMKLYGLSYCCNPQLFCCETMNCIFVGIPCVLCAVIASEAVIRSFFVNDLEFCNGVSDYKWSVWWVFATQILCITIGSFVVLLRWFIMVAHMDLTNFKSLTPSFKAKGLDVHEGFSIATFLFHIHFEFPYKALRVIYFVLGITILVPLYVIHKLITLVGLLVALFCLKVKNLCALMMIGKCREGMKKEMRSAPRADLQNKLITLNEDTRMMEWKLRMLANDTKRWMETNKRDAPTHLISLLSKSSISQHQSHSLLSRIQSKQLSYNDRVSGVTLVLLAILNSLISSPRTEYLMDCLSESKELIYFVEKTLNTKDAHDMLTVEWFQRMLAGRDVIARQLKRKLKFPLSAPNVQPVVEESVLDRTLGMIQTIAILGVGLGNDCDSICGSIKDVNYESIDELYECLEVTFLDMLSMLLADLPRAIFKVYHESYDIEEHDKKLRNAMKFFLKFELLGDKVKWSWPTLITVAQVTANLNAIAQDEGSHGVEGENENDGEIREIGPEDKV